MQGKMIARAKELLQNGTVNRVIGWKAGDFAYDQCVSLPDFPHQPSQLSLPAGRLPADGFLYPNVYFHSMFPGETLDFFFLVRKILLVGTDSDIRCNHKVFFAAHISK